MKILIGILLILSLFHIAGIIGQQMKLAKIIKQFDYSNTTRDDSWDWLVQAFEQVEMCTVPIVVGCKTRGLEDADYEHTHEHGHKRGGDEE